MSPQDRRSPGQHRWWARGRSPSQVEADVERINEIANGLTVASLALSADDDEMAKRTVDETLAIARAYLSQAVGQADARTRRRRAGAWAAGVTAAAAAAVGIVVVTPPLEPPAPPGPVATDEQPVTPGDGAFVSPHPGSEALLRERFAAGPGTAAVASTQAQRGRQAVTPPAVTATPSTDEEPSPQVTAASDRGEVTEEATVTAADTSGVAAAEETAESHPGLLASGRAQPAEAALANHRSDRQAPPDRPRGPRA